MDSRKRQLQKIEFAKQNYKRVPLDISKDEYTEWKNAADSAGESLNGFIKTSVRQRIERLSTDAAPGAGGADED